MKRIGLVGGLSWVSTVSYYEIINSTINEQLGLHYSADIILHSWNFQDAVKWMHEERWDLVARQLKNSVSLLEKAQVDYFLICCNSAHKVFDEISYSTCLPGLHIMEPIVDIINTLQYKKVGVLGTNFTMTEQFHKKFIKKFTGLDVIVPNKKERQQIHNIIFNNLCYMKSSCFNMGLQHIINQFIDTNGLDAVILACTELAKGINQNFIDAVVLDTTKLHAIRAAEFAISKNNIFFNKETTTHEYL